MRDGLVAYEERKGSPGRPKHMYHLQPAAEGLFPKYHAELTNELLSYVGDDDPELLERIFERRRDRRIAGARARLDGLSFGQQVSELARILDEDGYLAEAVAVDDGTFRIVEHNCAILGVAARYGQACSSELQFLRTVLSGADVERVSHMMAGQRHCAYAITPRRGRR
jgi:DeoR family suf operon transcriptional repressor